MIATNVNVSNAKESSAWSVFRKVNLSLNVTSVMNTIARVAAYYMVLTMKLLIFADAVGAMSNSNVAMIVN